MEGLLQQIRACTICGRFLSLGANPVVAGNERSKIIIIGQAPGKIVHQTNIPWNDKSGDNLHSWLGVDKDIFYNPDIFALVPMGFCYPGKGTSGDLPPRKECAPLWHDKLLGLMKSAKLTLLVGQYAQQYYLKEKSKNTLTETVRNFAEYLPQYLPLPHPSPRNNIWQAKNSWFKEELLPVLKNEVAAIIGSH